MLLSLKDNDLQVLNVYQSFFIQDILKCDIDLSIFYDLNISNDIANDYCLFDNLPNPSITNIAGITIPPSTDNQKIQILISENEDASKYPPIIFHELTHMHDMLLFAKTFCNNNLHEIKINKYSQTFINWSEFHAKSMDNISVQIFIDKMKNVPEKNILEEFSSQIKTFYYPEYTKKLQNKTDAAIRDIMYYFGELAVCNIYDKNNTYPVPSFILSEYGDTYNEIYNILFDCLDFNGFVKNHEDLYLLFTYLTINKNLNNKKSFKSLLVSKFKLIINHLK